MKPDAKSMDTKPLQLTIIYSFIQEVFVYWASTMC